MINWLRKVILKAANPFLVWYANRETKREIRGMFYHDSLKHLEKGDVIVTRTKGEFSNLLIPGFWKHAGIYIGKLNGVPYMIEAVGKGVVATELCEFLLTKDYAAILKPKFADEVQKGYAVEAAKSLVGKDYDFSFKSSVDAFYCSEVIWWSYAKVLIDSPFTPRDTWGEPTVLPSDFFNASEKWDMVLGKFPALKID